MKGRSFSSAVHVLKGRSFSSAVHVLKGRSFSSAVHVLKGRSFSSAVHVLKGRSFSSAVHVLKGRSFSSAVHVLKGRSFSCAVQAPYFVIPSGLQPARKMRIRVFLPTLVSKRLNVRHPGVGSIDIPNPLTRIQRNVHGNHIE